LSTFIENVVESRYQHARDLVVGFGAVERPPSPRSSCILRPENLRSPAMLICHCECVNDRRIRQEIGAGARTVGQVGRACRAGTRCGGCVSAVAELLEKTEARPSYSSYSRPLPLAAE